MTAFWFTIDMFTIASIKTGVHNKMVCTHLEAYTCRSHIDKGRWPIQKGKSTGKALEQGNLLKRTECTSKIEFIHRCVWLTRSGFTCTKGSDGT